MVSLEEVFVSLDIDAEAMLEKNQIQDDHETKTETKLPHHFFRG